MSLGDSEPLPHNMTSPVRLSEQSRTQNDVGDWCDVIVDSTQAEVTPQQRHFAASESLSGTSARHSGEHANRNVRCPISAAALSTHDQTLSPVSSN